MRSPLTFAVLDDLLLAREVGHVVLRKPLIENLSLTALGPALELRAIYPEELTAARIEEALGPVISAPSRRNSVVGHLPFEGLQPNSPEWVNFGIAAQGAAERAGFPKRIAQGLIGALGELQDNVFEHSCASSSGIVAYSARGNEFEFAVSDTGVGVLRSLRTATDWQSVETSEEALQIALSEGASRFGERSGHGYGFRGLFRGLATLGSHLRFRSGDASLEIAGMHPQLAAARVFQRPHLAGLHISVRCQQLR